jgi:hypothetical protein
MAPAVVVTVRWFLVFSRVRSAFTGLFVTKTAEVEPSSRFGAVCHSDAEPLADQDLVVFQNVEAAVHLMPDPGRGSGSKSSKKGKPRDAALRHSPRHLQELRRRFSIHRHRMIVGELPEEYIQCFANVHTMLNQSLYALIGLTDFALGLITAEKPVIAERFRVLLFRLPDAFGRLLLESLQLPLANCHAGTKFQFAHGKPPLPDRRSIRALNT